MATTHQNRIDDVDQKVILYAVTNPSIWRGTPNQMARFTIPYNKWDRLKPEHKESFLRGVEPEGWE